VASAVIGAETAQRDTAIAEWFSRMPTMKHLAALAVRFLLLLVLFLGLNACVVWCWEWPVHVGDAVLLVVIWVQLPTWLIVCGEGIGKSPLPLSALAVLSVLSAVFYALLVLPVLGALARGVGRWWRHARGAGACRERQE
jgi:hypothetical protein